MHVEDGQYRNTIEINKLLFNIGKLWLCKGRVLIPASGNRNQNNTHK